MPSKATLSMDRSMTTPAPGAVPLKRASAARERRRPARPVSVRIFAALSGPSPAHRRVRSERGDQRADAPLELANPPVGHAATIEQIAGELGLARFGGRPDERRPRLLPWK